MLLAGVVLILSPLIPPDQVVNENADADDHDDYEDHDDHDARKIALCDWTLLDGVELGLPEITD